MAKLFLNMCPDSALTPTTFSGAVKAGRFSAVTVFKYGGADLEALDTNGHPPLWHTTDSRMIQYLSFLGASPNAVSADGETVVDHAFENSCYDAVDTLVDCGADFLRVKLKNCKKLLCNDISQRNFGYLQKIVLQHIEILRDKEVIAGLRKIFSIGICDDETFEKILGHLRWFGAHCQSNTTSSVNLFDRSLVSLIPTDVGSSVLLIRHLLVKGANPNVYISGHGSALEAVAKGQDEECVEYLIEHGLDLDKFDHAYLERILQLAVTSGNSSVVQLLVEKGVDPDFNQKRTECGSGALIWEAVSRGHTKIVQLLIHGGADIHIRQDGWTLLGFAANNGLLWEVHYILVTGADPLEKSGPEEKTALAWVLCPSGVISESSSRERIASILIRRYTEEQLKSEGPRIFSLAGKMNYRRFQKRLGYFGVPLPKSCLELD